LLNGIIVPSNIIHGSRKQHILKSHPHGNKQNMSHTERSKRALNQKSNVLTVQWMEASCPSPPRQPRDWYDKSQSIQSTWEISLNSPLNWRGQISMWYISVRPVGSK
jgi:hypothetical protein